MVNISRKKPLTKITEIEILNTKILLIQENNNNEIWINDKNK